jgi:1,2-phenylacetyl-CoA epoxidase PaaB subunit
VVSFFNSFSHPYLLVSSVTSLAVLISSNLVPRRPDTVRLWRLRGCHSTTSNNQQRQSTTRLDYGKSKTMDRRRRVSSAASKALLSKQLASITDTLARASQRRDAEFNKVLWSTKASSKTADPALASVPVVPVDKPHQTRLKPAAAQSAATAATGSVLRTGEHTTNGTSSECFGTHSYVDT